MIGGLFFSLSLSSNSVRGLSRLIRSRACIIIALKRSERLFKAASCRCRSLACSVVAPVLLPSQAFFFFSEIWEKKIKPNKKIKKSEWKKFYFIFIYDIDHYWCLDNGSSSIKSFRKSTSASVRGRVSCILWSTINKSSLHFSICNCVAEFRHHPQVYDVFFSHLVKSFLRKCFLSFFQKMCYLRSSENMNEPNFLRLTIFFSLILFYVTLKNPVSASRLRSCRFLHNLLFIQGQKCLYILVFQYRKSITHGNQANSKSKTFVSL